MSDWKSRAIPINTPDDSDDASSGPSPASTNDWKSKATPVAPEVSQNESLARGLENGLTLGAGPKINAMAPGVLGGGGQSLGGLKSLLALMGADYNKDNDEDVKGYEKERDASKKAFDSAQKANPKTYMAGELGGSVLPALATGGVGEVPEAAGLGARLLGAAKVGGTFGAAQGALSSDADTLGGKLGDVAKGGLEGAATGGVMEGTLGSLMKGLSPEAMTELRNNQTLKAAGFQKGGLKLLEKQGRTQDVGANLFENGAVPPMSSVSDVLDNVQGLKLNAGNRMGSSLDQLDNNFDSNNPQLKSLFFNPSDVANKIRTQVLDPIKGEPIAASAENYVNTILQTIEKRGNQPISFEDAQKLLSLIRNQTNFSGNSGTDQIIQQAGGIINDELVNAADRVADAVGDSSLSENLAKAKADYGSAAEAEKAGISKNAGNMANRTFGITDYLSGGIGAGLDGGVGAAASMVGNKVLKKYANSMFANGADKAATIGWSGRALAQLPQDGLKAIADHMATSDVPLAQSAAKILNAASERDDVGRNALIFTLMQNPGYRELLDGAMGGSQNSPGGASNKPNNGQ